MGRNKSKLAWIANDAARRATFKKRKKEVMTKVCDLSMLCGVSACAIIYEPNKVEPEIWPSPSGAKRVLDRFRSLTDMEQCKKMTNQEELLRQRIAKSKEQIKWQLKENREKETKLMYQCLAGHDALHDLGLESLGDLARLIEAKVKAIDDRIQLLINMTLEISAAPLPEISTSPLPEISSTIVMPDMDNRDQRNISKATFGCCYMRNKYWGRREHDGDGGGGDGGSAYGAIVMVDGYECDEPK